MEQMSNTDSNLTPEPAVKEISKRRPYHEKYFLQFGKEKEPETIDIKGTYEFLKKIGHANGAMKQARNAPTEAELIEQSYIPNQPGKRYCDFCGIELSGAEFDRLSDGRERCAACGRTAVKTEEEFLKIYQSVIENMELFFDVRIKVPVTVKMVNARRLHRSLNETFIPTGRFDPRTLGYARWDKRKKSFTIFLENGSPRISTIGTLSHELTHIWQYTNWDEAQIRAKYGRYTLEIYEGMAKWVEIQYRYFIGETATAKREEIMTRLREDEYGRGFNMYLSQYPLIIDGEPDAITPFSNPSEPLEI